MARPLRVYLAGKITKNDWRCKLMPSAESAEEWRGTTQRALSLKTGIRRGLSCTGPFYMRCDHGCGHTGSGHGALGCGATGYIRQADVFAKCMDGIKSADAVVVWAGLDFNTAHGTMVEIGYAVGLETPVVLVKHPELRIDDCWFAEQSAIAVLTDSDPVSGLRRAVEWIEPCLPLPGNDDPGKVLIRRLLTGRGQQ